MAEGLSVESLSRGEPALIVQAEEPRILIVGLHGDETLAPRLAHHLYTEKPEYSRFVDYICGNPEAMAEGTRHVGYDLNRAFGLAERCDAEPPEIRARQKARAILGMIGTRRYDYVLDMHTSDTETEGFFLITRRNEFVDTIIGASVLRHVAVMAPHLIENTLMGAAAHAVSIEYARADEGRDVEESLGLVERLLIGETPDPQPREFFNVTREITKDEDPGDVPNFIWCPDGYYPVLLGKDGRDSYRNSPGDLLCFAADTMSREKL
ncbi:MAG TPA: succinylglutamate desuccinylase/aspartoacylase family protein [Candidatus Saccharimonadales bacterium]|nr:succinylglutamate desuccinylase/aspartoacylase family protein [Candidatus Saccharimonadales bacterium]